MTINMQDSKAARFGTLCSLYFSQGVPWAFIAVAFVAYLVGHDTYDISDDEVAALTQKVRESSSLDQLTVSCRPAFITLWAVYSLQRSGMFVVKVSLVSLRLT